MASDSFVGEGLTPSPLKIALDRIAELEAEILDLKEQILDLKKMLHITK